MTAHPDIFDTNREDRIRALAYRLWEEEGQTEGMAEEHWRRAAEIIDAEDDEEAESNHPQRLQRSATSVSAVSDAEVAEQSDATPIPAQTRMRSKPAAEK